MRPLPIGGVLSFEAWLVNRWTDSNWYVARGAHACSFGMLGLRWCEVEVLRPEDLFAGEGMVLVRSRKGGRPRSIEAPVGLLEGALAMRAGVAGGVDRVFVTRRGRGMAYGDVRRFVRAATVEVFGRRFTFHCFRHTAAVRCYERTRDVLAVQRLLGHTSLQWTNSYLASKRVVDAGGPIAFAGGGLVEKPRLYDPEQLGQVEVVKAVAARKRRRGGKAAAAGDQEAFDWDSDRAEEAAERAAERRPPPAKVVADVEAAFGEGGKWEGLTTAQAAERYADELKGMTAEEQEGEREEVNREIAGRSMDATSERWFENAERLREAKAKKQRECRHTDLVERQERNGRRYLVCRECGAHVDPQFGA